MADLQTRSVPLDVIQALARLQDREFRSRRELTDLLPCTIGVAESRRYAADILRVAWVVRPRRIGRYIPSVWTTNVASSRFELACGAYLGLGPLVVTLRLRRRWGRL